MSARLLAAALVAAAGASAAASLRGSAPDDAPNGTCDFDDHVERVCSADGCRVEVEDVVHRSCSEYCGSHGLRCVGAWEPASGNDTCEAAAVAGCDERRRTEGMICECEAPHGFPGRSCQLGAVEETCSADGCRVLAGGMRSRSCGDFCGAWGLACTGAWEELADSCAVEAAVGCEARLPTDDLICACRPRPEPVGRSPGGAPAPGRCYLHKDVDAECSEDGCRVRVEDVVHRSCSEFCGERRLRCIGAWEEGDEDCEVEAEVGCDARVPTNDLICECEAPGFGTEATP